GVSWRACIRVRLARLSSELSRPPPTSTLFPYTTLFRSIAQEIEIPRERPVTLRQGARLVVDRVQDGPVLGRRVLQEPGAELQHLDRKSTRLNSSHVKISYAVCCLKKKKAIDDTHSLASR